MTSWLEYPHRKYIDSFMVDFPASHVSFQGGIPPPFQKTTRTARFSFGENFNQVAHRKSTGRDMFHLLKTPKHPIIHGRNPAPPGMYKTL